jgi:hypothetical protein
MSGKKKTLYFDESGFTGYDLLNPEQPVFSVCSSDIDDELAEEILLTSFPKFKGEEFKFSQISRRSTHRKCLPAFAAVLAPKMDRIFAYYCDKRFTALTKVVDTLAEPMLHDSGFDFYANGFNRKYVNMFHFALNEFGDARLYDSILNAYDSFSRQPTTDSLAVMQKRFKLISESCPSELSPFLELVSVGADRYLDYHIIDLQKMSNDIQLTCVLSSVYYWRQLTNMDLIVVHDQSSNFFRQIGWWDQITSPDVGADILGEGTDREVPFPLNVTETKLGDSKQSMSLQLVDMIAGLAARMLHKGSEAFDKTFRDEIVAAGFGKLIFDGIRPGTEFSDGPPEELSGPDIIDQFTSIVGSLKD